MLDQRVARDNDPGGVRARVASDAFELAGRLVQAPHLWVAINGVLQLGRLVDGVGERDVERVRHELGDAIRLGVAHTEGAADIAQRGFRSERPERDDLRDVAGAVAFVGKADHLFPAVVGEVEVHIRHLAPFEVEEAFEDETVRHRVDIRHAEDVEHERSGRRPAYAHTDAGLARVIADLLDHVHVIREAGLLEHVEFIREAFVELRRHVLEAAVQPLEADLSQVLGALAAGRDWRLGQQLAVELEVEVALVRHQHRVRNELRVARIVGKHLVFGFDVVALAIEAVALRLVHRRVGADAEEHVVGLGFVRVGVVAVVGGDHRDAHFAANAGDHRVQAGELLVAVVLHLEVVMAIEDLPVPLRDTHRALAVTLLDAPVELSRGAAAEHRDARRVLLQQLAVDARLVVEALQVRLRDERDKVLVALHIAREHDQVVGRTVGPLSPEAAPRGDVGLDADDRLDPARGGLAVEIDGPVERAMIRHGDRFLAQRFHAVHQRRHLGHAVEQRELSVGV